MTSQAVLKPHFDFVFVDTLHQDDSSESMSSTPTGHFPLVIDPTSFDDYNPSQSTVGVHYRRYGPIQHQHRHYWGEQSQQSMMYGPYDPVPQFESNDAFVNQADEIDRHRQQYGQVMAGSTGTSGVMHHQYVQYSAQTGSILTLLHRSTNGHTAQADLRFARTYFQNPLYAVLNLDGGLATSPATSGYLNQSTATPTSAAGSSSVISPTAPRFARSEDFHSSSPLRRHSFNALPPRRISFSVHSPTSPSAGSGTGVADLSTRRLEGLGQRRDGPAAYAGLTNGNRTQRNSSGGSRSGSATSSALDGRLMSSPTALTTVDEESISHRDRGR